MCSKSQAYMKGFRNYAGRVLTMSNSRAQTKSKYHFHKFGALYRIVTIWFDVLESNVFIE